MLRQADFVPLRKSAKRKQYFNRVYKIDNVHPDQIDDEEQAEVEEQQYIKRNKIKIVCNVCCGNCKGDPIVCSRCKYSACRSCYKQYLLTKVIPQCMHCQQQWNEVYLRTIFSPYWVDTEYKRHQKLNLFKLEQSYIHQTSPVYMQLYKRVLSAEQSYGSSYNKRQLQQHRNYYVEDRRRLLKILKKRVPLPIFYNFEHLISNNVNNVSALSNDITQHLNNDERILVQSHLDSLLLHTRKIEHFESLKDMYKHEQARYQRYVEQQQLSRNVGQNINKSSKIKCVDNNCRGIITLGAKPICSVCNTIICKDCREVLTINPQQHQCDTTILESIRLIDSSTKCCPNCLTRIFRTEGCNHMFCSHCNTSFDWVTGDGLSEMVQSNMMYNEWQQRIRSESDNNQADSTDEKSTIQQLETQFLQSVICYDPGQFLSDRMKFEKLFFFNAGNRCAETHYLSVQKIAQQCHHYLSKHVCYEYNFFTNLHHRLRFMNNEIGEDSFMQYISVSFKKLQYDMELMMLVDTLRRCLLDWLSNLDVYVEQQLSQQLYVTKYISFLKDDNYEDNLNNIFYERNKIYNPIHLNECVPSQRSTLLFDNIECKSINIHQWPEFQVPLKLIEEFNTRSKELSTKFLYLQYVCVTYKIDTFNQYWMLYELGNLAIDKVPQELSVDEMQRCFHPTTGGVDNVSNFEHIKKFFT
jgi:hypothetical protein